MRLEQICLHHFRNIESAHLCFSPGVNLLYGANAQGKTNALEAIAYFAAAKSFRGAKEAEMIRFGEERCMMQMKMQTEKRELTLSATLFAHQKHKLEKNGVALRRTSDLVGLFRCVLFCPEHLSLIKGAPQQRRAFLDNAISQLKPSYLSSLVTYRKLLKQKNALLRDGEISTSKTALLEVLNAQMAPLHAHLVQTRCNYLSMLCDHTSRFVCEMTGGKETVQMRYLSSLMSQEERQEVSTFHKKDRSDQNVCEDRQQTADQEKFDTEKVQAHEKAIRASLTKQFYERAMQLAMREQLAKTTLVGAHRDDVSILLNDKDAKTYASQGQDRSLVLAMKLAEGEICRLSAQDYPVFLFDDVLSELDRTRQAYLMGQLHGRQVILTGCNEEWFDRSEINRIYVENGTYQPKKNQTEINQTV